MEEYIVSLFPFLVKEYSLTREFIVFNELKYFNFKIDNFKKLVMVGGGCLPFTPMFWAKYFTGPIVVLDKSKLATIISKRLIQKLGIKNVEILNLRGEDYDDYKDCIVLIGLHAEDKRMIIKKILENGDGNNVIFVRSFIDEQYNSLGKKWEVIEQNSNFHTLVLVIH